MLISSKDQELMTSKLKEERKVFMKTIKETNTPKQDTSNG